METQKNVYYVTLLLTAIAGYCDTVTFVAADKIFSAHVTGNFITFAYQMIHGTDIFTWVKLITFPVFIMSVMAGSALAKKSTRRYTLLLWEGIVLAVSGISAWLAAKHSGLSESWPMYTIAMLIVCAMGLQNAFGKLFSKDTLGPTTMMTGNVTQASLDLAGLLRTGFKDVDVWMSFKRQLTTIGGFLGGCVLGAVAGKQFGLVTVLLHGVIMILCYLKNKNTTV